MTPRSKREPTRVRSIRLPDRLWDAIEETAIKLGVKSNGLVWRAVEDWLVRRGAMQKGERSMSEATMVYTASRGGHAPGHLRDAFLDWIDRLEESESDLLEDLQPNNALNQVGGDDIFYDGSKPLKWLIGQLWNCTDTIPGDAVTSLGDILEGYFDEPQNVGTYGMAVRAISDLVESLNRRKT